MKREPILLGQYPIIVMYAIALHLVWAIGLIIDPSSAGATAVNSVIRLFGEPMMSSAALILVAVAAMIGLLDSHRRRSVILLLPQQFLLYVSAFGSYLAIRNGMFPDGVVRSPWFIAVDQAPAILSAIGHTLAIVKIVRSP